MKLLVTGANGQLGYDLLRRSHEFGTECIGYDADTMDITDPEQVKRVFEEEKWDGVIHCAAWTAVDKAEDPELLDTVRAVNAAGTDYIAQECAKRDIPLMYFSTDYVFDGQGEKPWKEDDAFDPLNVYGLTKAEGEEFVRRNPKHFIVRISWVFGLHGNNFVKTMLKLADSGKPLQVVADQIGSPTYTWDLAGLALQMIQTQKYGTYHATNQGYCSWYEFAKGIFEAAGKHPQITFCDSSAFPAKAKRPHNSRMSQEALVQNGFALLPDWRDAVKRYLQELEEDRARQ